MKIVQKLAYANGNMPLTEEEKQEMIKEAAEHYGRYMDAMKLIGEMTQIVQIHL